MTPPLVSIIMPVYNCESFVADAIDSMLRQTLSDFELIIIDDHSLDNTRPVIESYRDRRIIFIQKEANSGLISSLNLGIATARGQYIARMDGDDISDGTRLEKQIAYFQEHPEVMICGTACRLLGSDQLIQFPSDHDEIKMCLLEYCPLIHPTVMFRKQFFTGHKLFYNKEFEWAEDYELWTRAVWLGRLGNLPTPLLSYRLHPKQVTHIYKQRQDENSLICRVNMLRKIWAGASPEDFFTRALLFQDVVFSSIAHLNEVTRWMDELVTFNNGSAYFNAARFRAYIAVKKTNSVRRFFLNQTTYTPAILYRFLLHLKAYKGCFSPIEHVKLALKCLAFGGLNSGSR